MNGLRTHEENVSGNCPTFTQVEHDYYEQRYGPYLAGQTERNVKAGHAKRNRSVGDLLQDQRVCPEETVYQIGKEGDNPPPDLLLTIEQRFLEDFDERFGAHVHILDWALHLDEMTAHFHVRQVFDYVNRYGEIEPKQEKALEELGIPLPDPTKKQSRYNNRKITFDSICREMLLSICQEYGLEVETEAIYGGKASRDKNDYIIENQRKKIAELEKLNAELTAANEEKSRMLAVKEAKLDRVLAEIADADAVIDAVSNAVYAQAVKDVTLAAVNETHEAEQNVIHAMVRKVNSPELKRSHKEKDAMLDCLSSTLRAFDKAKKKVLDKVIAMFNLPYKRQTIMTQVKEKVKPSIKELLLAHVSDAAEHKHPNPHQRTDELR